MRYMGLDLGTRTCGVAFSDYTETIATFYDTLRFRDNDLQKCLEYVIILVNEKKVDKVVLGFPINMNGTLGPKAEYCQKFKEMLEESLKMEVVLYDERLTTVEVTKVMISADISRKKRKTKVDALAATLILQSYLDSKKIKEKKNE